MKRFLKVLATAPAFIAASAFAEGATDLTPADISALYTNAEQTITNNIPHIAGVLAVGFGIVIAFWAYRMIKRAANRAG